MSDALIALMHELVRGIGLETMSADAMFGLAEKAEVAGRLEEASTVRSIARMHRAKVIKF